MKNLPLTFLVVATAATGQIGPANIAHSDKYLVSAQELRHVVPPKAKSECDSAEKARQRGRTGDAIRHFEQAVALDSEFVAARNNLAVLYLAVDKVELGIGHLEQAIKSDPHNSLLFSNLAIGHLLIHDAGAAERAAREAINLNPASIQAHALLGLALMEAHKFNDETVSALQKAQDDYPAVRFHLAYVFVHRGNLPQARSELESYLASGDREHQEQATNWLDRINQSERNQLALQRQQDQAPQNQ